MREKTWKKGHRIKRREETGKDKEMKKSRLKSLRGGNLKKKKLLLKVQEDKALPA